MNLHPTGTDPGGPLAPADWTMSIGSEEQGETVHYFADGHPDGVRICRLALTGLAALSRMLTAAWRSKLVSGLLNTWRDRTRAIQSSTLCRSQSGRTPDSGHKRKYIAPPQFFCSGAIQDRSGHRSAAYN